MSENDCCEAGVLQNFLNAGPVVIALQVSYLLLAPGKNSSALKISGYRRKDY